MRIRFRFRYGQDFDVDQTEALTKLVGTPIEVDDDGKVKSYPIYGADLPKLLSIVLPSTIELEGLDSNSLLDVSDSLQALGRKIDAIGPVMNERVNVSVPGFALMEIRELAVWPDACTDHLQDALNEGWHILAICPQPDQRRPDYILGRSRKDDK